MRRTKCLAIAVAVAGFCCLSGSAFAYTVYVSNEKGNSISVIDGATLEIKETVPVGQRPRGIMFSLRSPPMTMPRPGLRQSSSICATDRHRRLR